MVLSNYKNKNANLILEQDKKVQITPISYYRNKALNSGQSILIGRRIKGNSWTLLEAIEVVGGEKKVNEILNLDIVWKKMTKYWSSDNPANSLEIFVTKNSKYSELIKKSIENQIQVEIDYIALPGVYLFPKSSLQKVKVEKNNRAILLPTKKVLEMVKLAFDSENFTYLPNWY